MTTHEQHLDLVIEDWRGKLAAAERQQEDAGAVALEDPARAAALLQEAATAALVAQRAIATLEARRPQAQAEDLEARAADLDVQAVELQAQAAPIAAEVDRLIAAALALGVSLARRGDPQRDAVLLSEARSRRVDAHQLRQRARALLG